MNENEEIILDFDQRMTEKYGLSHQVTVFPTSVSFPPTYPNVNSHFTVFFANPSHNPQAINISFENSSNFTVSNPQSVIEGGSVFSCVISFLAKEPGSYSGILNAKIDGMNPCVVVLEAKCYNSPLVFPKDVIEHYVFSDCSTNCNFEIINNSIETPLHIYLSNNSPAFSIDKPSIQLNQCQKEEVEILFNPKIYKEVKDDIFLNVQCAESGDSFQIQLSVGQIRNIIDIDFGTTSIGQVKIHKINTVNPNQITEIQPPFYITIQELVKDTEQTYNNQQPTSILKNKKSKRNSFEDEEKTEINTKEKDNYNDEENDELRSEFFDDQTEISIFDQNNESQVVVKYCSNEEGHFEDNVEFDNFILHLKGNSVAPFYVIDDKDIKDGHLIITNTTNDMQKCFVAFTDTFDNKTEIIMRPGKSKDIRMGKHKELFIQWFANSENENGEEIKVIDSFKASAGTVIKTPTNSIIPSPKPKSENRPPIIASSMPITVDNDSDHTKHISLVIDNPQFVVEEKYKTLVLPPHSTQSVNVSYTPNKTAGASASIRVIDEKTKTEVSHIAVTGAIQLVSDVSFIPFFGVTHEPIKAFIKVSGAPIINVYSPEWITAPEEIEEGQRCTLECKNSPGSAVVDFITFDAENAADLDVPILAYHGHSDISFKSPSELTKKGDNLITTIEVVNNGIRPGFVIFTCKDDDNQRQVQASPPCAIIQPAKKKLFKFVIEDGEGPVSVMIHYGDEILRQMRSFLRPKSFYSTIFENIEVRDEISAFTDIMKKVNEKEFSQYFKKGLVRKTINLLENANEEERTETMMTSTLITKAQENAQFSISESEVDFGIVQLGQEVSRAIWIENLTRSPLDLKLSTVSPYINIPEKIFMRSEEHRKLIINILTKESYDLDTIIEITNGVDNKLIHIIGEVEEPMTQIEILDFGTCQIGRLYRGKIKITNKKKRPVVISTSIDSPFSIPVPSIEVGSGCFIKFPVHFLPTEVGAFQGTLNFKAEGANPFSVTVVGKGEN